MSKVKKTILLSVTTYKNNRFFLTLLLSTTKIYKMILSACGLICNECEFFNKTCTGCIEVKGSTFWAKEMMPDKVCPLFDCSVNQKGFRNCGDCNELPCKMFREMKDPNSTEEQHQQSLLKRVEALRGN